MLHMKLKKYNYVYVPYGYPHDDFESIGLSTWPKLENNLQCAHSFLRTNKIICMSHSPDEFVWTFSTFLPDTGRLIWLRDKAGEK